MGPIRYPVFAVLALGCSGSGTALSTTSPSGPTGAAGGGANHGSDVHCTATDGYYTTKDVAFAPGDLSSALVEAVVFDSSPAGATTYPGMGYADGTCQVAGVPEGPYLLHVRRSPAGTGRWLATDARTVDVGADFAARLDESPLTTAATLHLELSGLLPQAGSLVLLSGTGGLSAQTTLPLLAPNSGHFSDSIDVPAGWPALVSDDLWVLQATTTPTTEATEWSIVSAEHVTDLTVSAGATSVVTATLHPPPPLGYSFSIDQAALDAMTSSPGAGAGRDVFVFAGRFLPVHSRRSSGLPTQFQGTITNPFPTSWPLDVRVYSYLHEGQVEMVAPLTNDGSVVTPTLGLVRNATVDGHPAPDAIVAGSTTPTVQWDPPLLGTPSWFFVYVDRKDNGDSAWEVYTRGTSVRIPPGVLAKGVTYSVRVGADASDGSDATRAFSSSTAAKTIATVATLAP